MAVKPYRYWTHGEKKQHNTGVDLPSAVHSGIPLAQTSANRADDDTLMKVVATGFIGIRWNPTDPTPALLYNWELLTEVSLLVGFQPTANNQWVDLNDTALPTGVLGIYPMVLQPWMAIAGDTGSSGGAWRTPIACLSEARRAGTSGSGGSPTVYTSLNYFSADAVGSAVGGYDLDWVIEGHIRALWASDVAP